MYCKGNESETQTHCLYISSVIFKSILSLQNSRISSRRFYCAFKFKYNSDTSTLTNKKYGKNENSSILAMNLSVQRLED